MRVAVRLYAGKWLFGWCRQVMGLYARVNGWLATRVTVGLATRVII